eukprot:13020129-Alexandrium_andersonii.AAC.1
MGPIALPTDRNLGVLGDPDPRADVPVGKVGARQGGDGRNGCAGSASAGQPLQPLQPPAATPSRAVGAGAGSPD